MNKHFEDARYYLNRAADTAKEGVKEELEPVRERFSRAEEEPEPGRMEKLQDQLEEVEGRAEGEARRAITSAKGRIKSYRESE